MCQGVLGEAGGCELKCPGPARGCSHPATCRWDAGRKDRLWPCADHRMGKGKVFLASPASNGPALFCYGKKDPGTSSCTVSIDECLQTMAQPSSNSQPKGCPCCPQHPPAWCWPTGMEGSQQCPAPWLLPARGSAHPPAAVSPACRPSLVPPGTPMKTLQRCPGAAPISCSPLSAPSAA